MISIPLSCGRKVTNVKVTNVNVMDVKESCLLRFKHSVKILTFFLLYCLQQQKQEIDIEPSHHRYLLM